MCSKGLLGRGTAQYGGSIFHLLGSAVETENEEEPYLCKNVFFPFTMETYPNIKHIVSHVLSLIHLHTTDD
jgi:hypothetical protein